MTSFNQTPLFQLNLMLWLVMPSAAHKMRPIFYEEGFLLQSIGQNFRVPIGIVYTLNTNSILVGKSASPDLLLRHQANRTMLPIECKVSGFGYESTNCAQATALLSISGEEIAGTIGISDASTWISHLLYAVSQPDHVDMLKTLQELSGDLNNFLISPNVHSSLGIVVATDGIYLQAVSNDHLLETVMVDHPMGLKVMDLPEGYDPRPLYLIPIDPSIQTRDPIENQILNERLRQTISVLIGSRVHYKEVVISFDEIMQSTIEVWEQWKDQNPKMHLLKKIVRPYVKTVLVPISKLGAKVHWGTHEITISGLTIEIARKIKKYLISKEFRSGEIDLWKEFQPGFGDMNDQWND